MPFGAHGQPGPAPTKGPGRRRPAPASIVTAFLLAALCALAAAAPVAPGQTIVSLEFDDSWGTQFAARQILADHGMHGTFFVISGLVGRADRLTFAQLHDLEADGNEIAGHTVDHPHLTTLTPDGQRREICDDRVTLLGQGLAVRSFAYPYGQHDATTERIAADCGYNSARGVGGVGAPTVAESVPPANPFATRTPQGVNSTTTTADLEAVVANAESAGGGWVQIVFHQLCAGCGIYSADPSLLAQFADWLAPRAASGTVVRTVGDVIGGPIKAGVPGPPAAARAGNLVPNPSLEQDADANGVPDCWLPTGYGANVFSWARTTDAHVGAFAERVDINALTSGDRKLISPLDRSGCAPAAAPGRAYALGESYMTTAPTRFVVYTRDATGAWGFWITSPYFPASVGWSQASWITPPTPAGATAISAGLALGAVGSATFDDLTVAANLLENESLERDANTDGTADCWQRTGYGTNQFSWTRTTDAHTGTAADRVQITALTSGDRKLIAPLDQGPCAPTPTPGHVLQLSGWYKTDGTVRLLAYTRSVAGAWSFWTKSAPLPPSAGWTRGSFVTPPVPAGVTAVSAGLALMSVGTATFDDLALFDAG